MEASNSFAAGNACHVNAALGRSRSTLIERFGRYNWLIFNRLLRGLPSRCLLCNTPLADGSLCGGCYLDLPWRTVPDVRSANQLLAFASFSYAFPVRELIGAAKFRANVGIAREIGRLMWLQRPESVEDADLVCAIPLPYWRAVTRGYNQALEIARPIAAAMGRPLHGQALFRRGQQSAQRRLSRAARQENVQHAFGARDEVRGCRILLVDDVVTTGATFKYARRALLRAGAQSVCCWAATAVD